MPITKAAKQKTIKKHQKHETDTGSLPVTIAVLSKRIDELAIHLQTNKKDKHSRRGLLGMVAERRKLLTRMMESDQDAYAKLTKELGLKTKTAKTT